MAARCLVEMHVEPPRARYCIERVGQHTQAAHASIDSGQLHFARGGENKMTWESACPKSSGADHELQDRTGPWERGDISDKHRGPAVGCGQARGRVLRLRAV